LDEVEVQEAKRNSDWLEKANYSQRLRDLNIQSAQMVHRLRTTMRSIILPICILLSAVNAFENHGNHEQAALEDGKDWTTRHMAGKPPTTMMQSSRMLTVFSRGTSLARLRRSHRIHHARLQLVTALVEERHPAHVRPLR
jgi:hypothetical protein